MTSQINDIDNDNISVLENKARQLGIYVCTARCNIEGLEPVKMVIVKSNYPALQWELNQYQYELVWNDFQGNYIMNEKTAKDLGVI